MDSGPVRPDHPEAGHPERSDGAAGAKSRDGAAGAKSRDGAGGTSGGDALPARELAILDVLARRGASFFAELHAGVGGGYEQATVDALWSLVWKGLVTNDGFQALRAYCAPPAQRQERGRLRARAGPYRSRLTAPPAASGRWTLVETRRAIGPTPTPTEWSAATAEQLLVRYGLVTREVAQAEGLPGGFSAVYEVFRLLEESGRIRRGYFVSDVGAMQFAQPGALDLLRSLRDAPEQAEVVILAATDPANPYGALLKWPPVPGAPEGRRPARAVGAQVVLVNGELGAWLSRGVRQVFAWLPEDEPDRSTVGEAVAQAILSVLRGAMARGEGTIVAEVNGADPARAPLAAYLLAAGFLPSSLGLQLTRRAAAGPAQPADLH